jgi:DNA repair ATPase RecN
MIKEDPYQIKFDKLSPWIIDIFQVIKKDLRNDHLFKSPAFVQKHFPKCSLDKLTIDEFANAYVKEFAEGNEELGEKVVARWVLKNADLYQFFVAELSKINPKYDEIDCLSAEIGSFLLSTSISRFGATATYIFSVLNAVVFTDEQFRKLREMALLEKSQAKPLEEKRIFESIEAVKEHYEKEMRKLTEKYEKRMQGVERKYIQDVEGLKKQIAQLHKKIGERSVGV